MTKGLTKKQEQVLQYIGSYLEERGYPPSIREISQALALSGPHSVKKMLDSLERKGRIRRHARRSRAIELIGPRQAGFIQVPLAGRVRAGQPALAVEDIEDYYSLDRDFCRCDDPFLLRVQGDSMQDVHITDGDLVLVRPQPMADNGDIVVALLAEEATVKRFFREQDRIVLKPENSSMKPLIIKAEDDAPVSIAGKVVAVLRQL